MKTLKISTPLHTDFLPVITNFIENTSCVFGIDKQGALKLTLASEEVFSYLCNVIQGDKTLDIICTGGIYFVAVEFSFDKIEIDLKAFNITATPSSESEESFREMGLLIAARSVDSLSLEEASDERLVLRLIKEKSYPPSGAIELPHIPPMASFVLKVPIADEIKAFSHLLQLYYKKYPLPDAFRCPGKLVDMVTSTLYGISIATDERGLIGGGIIWKRMNEKIVEFFGPYLFNQQGNNKMAESLINVCIEGLARTEIIGVFCRYPTEAFPAEYFESIGTITFYEHQRNQIEFPCYYRQLHEDTGAYVYVPRKIASFIEAEYKRLVLPRQVYLTDYSGEYRGDYSVFASELDKELNQVIIRPLLPGEDCLNNILKHMEIFKKEQILNCFFEIDLGVVWQAYVVDSLMECGFKPCLIIPYGGKSDLVIFQYTP